MVDIPDNTKNDSEELNKIPDSDDEFLNKPSVLKFGHPISRFLSDQLLNTILSELLPDLQEKDPEISINPLFNSEKELIAIDFFKSLSKSEKERIQFKINRYIYLLQRVTITENIPTTPFDDKISSKRKKKNPVSFTELLGTYRVTLNRFYIPVLVCIFTATFLAWLTVNRAGIEINAALVDPEESTVWGTILNGLLPVVISAIFITVIYLVVRKVGLNFFKVLMGLIVMFYVWFGFNFYVEVIYMIIYNTAIFQDSTWLVLYILYYVLFYGSAIFQLIVTIQFFRGKLSTTQRNIIILLFGIFLGSIIGISFPTWTTVLFAVFLSIWDLIAVFKGPLGKISEILMENRDEFDTDLKQRVARGEITEEQADELSFSSIQDEEMQDIKIKDHLSEIEIELGSGDLILYSGLVAHVFVATTSWLITGMVIVGVMFGAVLTLYFLIKKKRVLPALPFSMLFGLIMFGLGWLLITFL